MGFLTAISDFFAYLAEFIGSLIIRISGPLLIFCGVFMFTTVATGDDFGGMQFQSALGVFQGAAIDGSFLAVWMQIPRLLEKKRHLSVVLHLVMGTLLGIGVYYLNVIWLDINTFHVTVSQALVDNGIDPRSWFTLRGVIFVVVGVVVAVMTPVPEKHIYTEAEVAQIEEQAKLKKRLAVSNADRTATNIAAALATGRAAFDAAVKGNATATISAGSAESEHVSVPVASAESEVAPAPGPAAPPQKRKRTPRPAATPVIASNAINRSHNSSPYSDNSESLPYGSPAGNGGLIPPVGTESLYEHTLSPQEERSAEISAAATGAPAGRLHLSVPTGGYRS